MGAEFESRAPADGAPVWSGAEATHRQVFDAVAAARHAFTEWSMVGADDRIGIARSFASIVQSRSDDLAALISLEVGKPLWEARTEVAAVTAKVDHSVNAYGVRTGIVERDAGPARSVTRHRPHGVFAVFGPFNFPAHLPNGHIVPALIAGNTVVFKPSELTPGVGEALIRMWVEAGTPDGVVNLVQGGPTVGEALVDAPIDGLLFTGSARVGRLLHKQLAGRPEVLLALEMGGNNALIVLEGADVPAAVAITVQSAFITAGQRCTCARRLLVPAGDYGNVFVSALVDAASRLRVGQPSATEAPFMGPLISEAAARRILESQRSLIELGATPLLTMGPVPGETAAFVTPGILDATGVDVPDEEHFGPLLLIHRYDTLDEAIGEANRTAYGLAAGIVGGDSATYAYVRERLKAGVINWNRPTTGASSGAPFGGVGASGNHRPSAFYAADYAAHPVASLESEALEEPVSLPGQQ